MAKRIGQLPEVELVKVGEIKPAPDNPRQIPQSAIDAVTRSLERFGWKQPLVLDANNVIVVGHTRLAAAKALKLAEVPVVRASDLDQDEVAAYRIMDNRAGDYSTWDMPQLVQQLEDLDQKGFGETLGLADWEAVLEGFAKHLGNDDGLLDLELDGPAKTFLMSGGWEVGVVFSSKEAALAAEKVFIEMEGVVDVRHKR